MRGNWALKLALPAMCALALAGCEREARLAGDRLPLRGEAAVEAPVAGPVAAPDAARPFAAPAVTRNADWTHRGGNAQHGLVNPALGAAAAQAWAVRIGQGDDARHRITADPVVAAGRVFTLDSRAQVAAVSTAGRLLWTRDLTPPSDRADDASGGGLATDGARVYVTTAFGRLHALDARTGAELWSQRLDAAATSAPTVADGTVYAVSTDSRGWALDAETGRIVWETQGAPSPAGVLGGAAPTVTDRVVVLPYPSAEITGNLRLSGFELWKASVAGRRLGRAYGAFSDVTGDAVVDGDRLIVGNPTGRTRAIDLATGDVLWSAAEGALAPPQVAGGSVFVLSDQNQLVRIDAATGETVWAVPLPYYPNTRPRRLRTIADQYGPILAGGRLLVAGGDGALRSFDPASGNLLGATSLPGGAAALPAVAGGTLFAVTADGMLRAFR